MNISLSIFGKRWVNLHAIYESREGKNMYDQDKILNFEENSKEVNEQKPLEMSAVIEHLSGCPQDVCDVVVSMMSIHIEEMLFLRNLLAASGKPRLSTFLIEDKLTQRQLDILNAIASHMQSLNGADAEQAGEDLGRKILEFVGDRLSSRSALVN